MERKNYLDSLSFFIFLTYLVFLVYPVLPCSNGFARALHARTHARYALLFGDTDDDIQWYRVIVLLPPVIIFFCCFLLLYLWPVGMMPLRSCWWLWVLCDTHYAPMRWPNYWMLGPLTITGLIPMFGLTVLLYAAYSPYHAAALITIRAGRCSMTCSRTADHHANCHTDGDLQYWLLWWPCPPTWLPAWKWPIMILSHLTLLQYLLFCVTPGEPVQFIGVMPVCYYSLYLYSPGGSDAIVDMRPLYPFPFLWCVD